MRQRLFSARSGLFGAAIGCAWGVVAGPLRAQEVATPPPVPLAATSQCVQGPGAPPSDPSKQTRVTAAGATGEEAAVAEDLDAPGAPSRVLLELGAFGGASVRLDDAPVLETTRRAGLVLGGSLFVSPSRTLSLGLSYAHVDISGSESAPLSADVLRVSHEAHALFGEVRVTPFRFASGGVFAALGAGLAWQSASLRATLPPIDGGPGGSFVCSTESGADFGFRAGLGVKARLGRAASLLSDVGFVGYRFSGGVLDGCAPGAGTAQTVMLRVGVTYDLDITHLTR